MPLIGLRLMDTSRARDLMRHQMLTLKTEKSKFIFRAWLQGFPQVFHSREKVFHRFMDVFHRSMTGLWALAPILGIMLKNENCLVFCKVS